MKRAPRRDYDLRDTGRKRCSSPKAKKNPERSTVANSQPPSASKKFPGPRRNWGREPWRVPRVSKHRTAMKFCTFMPAYEGEGDESSSEGYGFCDIYAKRTRSPSTSLSSSGHDEDDASNKRPPPDPKSKAKAKAPKADGQGDVHASTRSAGTQTDVEAQVNKDGASGAVETQKRLTIDDIRKAIRSTTVNLKPQVFYLNTGGGSTLPGPSNAAPRDTEMEGRPITVDIGQLQGKSVDDICAALLAEVDCVFYMGDIHESLLHYVENGILPPTVESLKALAKLQIAFLEKLRDSGSASERVLELSSHLARASEMIANLD